MLIIAEIAYSHNGKILQLKRPIEKISMFGADTIQFQIWNLKLMMSSKNKIFKKV